MEPEEEQKQVIKKELVFAQYPSIQLWTRDKIVKLIRESDLCKENVLWVASEKIHGSNFSVHCTESTVKYGRRTDFLTKEIPIECEDPKPYFLESFFGAGEFMHTIHNKFGNIYKKLKEVYPEMIKFSVYGEYFGGSWPKATDSKCKPVQKGVYYTPYHDFMAFDIKVFTNQSVFWVDVLDIPKFCEGEIKYVPVYKRGTFEELYNMDIKMDSTIPELLGLEKIENNIIEGMVIRPNTNVRIPKLEGRVILKKKNQQYAEVKQTKPAKEKKEKLVNPHLVPYLEELEKYVNINRVESLMSKFPDEKNRKKLNDQLTKDVLSDAQKEGFKWPEQNALLKEAKTELNKMTMKILNEYFLKH